ncbi:DUF2298 domain-containing protein [Halomarina litorea]|uniref:DUF2298 domain-containing protein n=1 Tax=Halomarina litorea TaxID=2961595 RepID=UPI0020C496C7|nr:DUF2298 domain-containing protein [Halomarina sp. BCD28]
MEYGLVALWLATYLSLLVAGVPLLAALCPRLADRGAGVALPAALAIVGFVAWAVGHVSFGWPALLAGNVVLVSLLALAVRRGALVGVEWEAVAETAVVFTLAFLAMVAVRAVDPSVHATMGEKFLDFGLLKSLLRAESVPPGDFWFAGEAVQYYYGGHLLAALLARLTFTEARFAYNLALAGFFGMFVTAAYGLAGSVGAHMGANRTTAGALGAFFVGLASNLWTPLRLLGGVLPDGLVNWAAGVGGIEGFTAAGYDPVGEFTYWGASRVIPGTINEFPLFAYLNGDLHAHMMSTPFLLLAATLAYSYYRTPEAEVGRRWLLLGSLAPLSALVAVVNTWSFPTVFGVAWLAVAFAPADPLSLVGLGGDETRRPDSWLARELRWTGGALGVVALLAVGGVLLSLPFWLGTASGRAVALVEDHSPLVGLLVVHGTFLLVTLPYLLGWGRRAVDARTLGLGVAGMLFVGSFAWLLGFAAFLVAGPVALGAWALLRLAPREAATDADGPGFAAVLMLAATGLVLLVELVYIREEAGPGRMNTVFKTYAQVWALWAPAAGAALGTMLARGRPAPTLTPFRSADRAAFGDVGLVQVGVVLLVVSTSAYGALAAADHFTAEGHYDADAQELYPRTDDPTLDALAFVDTYRTEEAAAIRWLDERPGRVVVAEAPGRQPYTWANAPTTLTGHQSVVGWAHEIGYRGREAYTERARDADWIFGDSPRRTAKYLAAYDVDYVYVGPRERAAYGEVSFDRVPGVTVAKRFDGVTIYRVDQSALETGGAAANGSAG